MRTVEANDITWITTYSGDRFWPCEPRWEDVSIFDIAHALSLVCRWTGHIRKHYSVGQHSVVCSYLVPRDDALWALMHDASEAYISDIARPTKPLLSNYYALEAAIMKQICLKFNLPYAQPASVKTADSLSLLSEARDLTRASSRLDVRADHSAMLKLARTSEHATGADGLLPNKVRPWPMWWSELRFLARYAELTNTRWETFKGYVALKWFDLCQ